MTGCEECDGQHWCPYCEAHIEAEHEGQDNLTRSLGPSNCLLACEHILTIPSREHILTFGHCADTRSYGAAL